MDLGTSLQYGAGGTKELLERSQRLYSSKWASRSGLFDRTRNTASGYALSLPWLTLWMKWACYLAGGFLLGAAAHLARPGVSELERPLQVSGLHLAREFRFRFGFFVGVLLLTEPYLSQESQKPKTFLPIRAASRGQHEPVINCE